MIRQDAEYRLNGVTVGLCPVPKAVLSSGNGCGRHSRRSDMNRRFGFLWIWGLTTAAIATVVGLIAYHAGQTAAVVATTPGGNEVVYHGYYGFGFFPFFGLFWLLLIVFIFSRLFFCPSCGPAPCGYPAAPHPT